MLVTHPPRNLDLLPTPPPALLWQRMDGWVQHIFLDKLSLNRGSPLSFSGQPLIGISTLGSTLWHPLQRLVTLLALPLPGVNTFILKSYKHHHITVRLSYSTVLWQLGPPVNHFLFKRKRVVPRNSVPGVFFTPLWSCWQRRKSMFSL